MPIDARIPLMVGQQGGGFGGNLARGLVSGFEKFGEEQKRRKLSDLVRRASGRGGVSEDGALGEQEAIDELWAIDPNLAMRLDDRQREQAKAMTQDLGAAVRWADTPDKWQYVQQHYSGQGVDLSPYRFEDRERGLVALGQIDSYLDAAPKPNQGPASVQEYEFAKQNGFTGGYMDFLEGKKGPIVANNGDGTLTLIPRNYGSQQPSGQPKQITSKQEYDALDRGTPYIAPDGSRRTKGGQTASTPSGGFPSAGY